MISTGFLAGLLLSGGGATVTFSVERIEMAQLNIRQSVIVRVPTRSQPTPAAPIEWKESKGPKCLPTNVVAGATVVESDSIDIILRDGNRVRVEFEDDCPAIDYYRNFYIRPTADRRICAGRDSIHARSGGECQIHRFRTLTPIQRKKK
ncbi:hypothetical protein [Sphingomonas sp. KC8]|uniref:hypothetical protein n=1 Tax=Sphingomonas sp. KC8 TaxID=1030157 RepID=UPI0002F79F2E|nr:hypothetical protein [Sphingomonas sp. KC8]ARS29367.1 hypothetical protein KC8_19020 [Sphingomonas sp. KC8]